MTPDTFDEVLSSIQHCKRLFLDTETSGLDIYTTDRVIGISLEVEVAPKDFRSFYFTFGHVEHYVTVDGETYLGPEDHKSVKGKALERHYTPNLTYDTHMPQLIEYIYSYTRKSYWWNASFDAAALHREAGYVPDKMYDVMLLAHLCDENATAVCEKLGTWKPSFRLKDQGILVDDDAAEAEAELKKKMKKHNMAEYPARDIAAYAEQDVILTRKLYEHYAPIAISQNVAQLWNRVCKYMRTLIRMSIRGIRLLPDVVEQNAKECEEKIEELIAELRDRVGDENFNPNSPKQVMAALDFTSTARDVLEHFVEHGWNYKELVVKDEYGNLVYTPLGTVKTRKVKHRLNDEQLKIAELMLLYRAWSKMLTTYYRPYKVKKDHNDVLHPGFSLHGTVSGRLSSSNPNLQQVPRQSDKARVKEVFIPRDGYVLVECDYKAAELVMGAYLAEEIEMLTTLRDGRDLHKETAEQLGVDRTKAKNVGFGTIYGLGPPGLAKQLGISKAEAAKILKNYHKLRPNFRLLYESAQETAEQTGQIVMWTGRIRHYDYTTPTHKAISHLIQGSTAEVTRVALTKLGEVMPTRGVYPLITVHDSVLLEVPVDENGGPEKAHLAEIKNIMEFRHWCPEKDGAQNMERLVPFKGDHNFFVPMRIDMKWGDSWGYMPYEVENWVEPEYDDYVYLPYDHTWSKK